MNNQKSRESIEQEIRIKSIKDSEFRQQLLDNPKVAIETALGLTLPKDLNIKVVEETSTNMALAVPPALPESSDELSDEQLEAVAGGATPTLVVTVTAPFAIEEITKW